MHWIRKQFANRFALHWMMYRIPEIWVPLSVWPTGLASSNIICSQNTVDVYNPKTIQATMGGIARVKVHYTSPPDFIRSLGDTPVFGTFPGWKNMYEQPLSANGLIVMGNEGNGIGKEVATLINRKLYIPNYPAGQETSESLNVAIATAVICAEFRRQAAWK